MLSTEAMPVVPRPRLLPPDDPSRIPLHDEVHARPPARIRLPARLLYVALLNEAVSRDDEATHLRRLPGAPALPPEALAQNFMRLRHADWSLRWERHTEFTRYTLVQPLSAEITAAVQGDGGVPLVPLPLGAAAPDEAWWRGIPGLTFAAVELLMLNDPMHDHAATLAAGRRWFGDGTVVASLMGGGHSCAVTDFRVQDSGFERLLVLAPTDTTPTRAGRISQRLLELETYRLMALRGLPVAKTMAPVLQHTETDLAAITAQLEDAAQSDQVLLERLTHLAVQVERATAEHGFRFSATQAYDALVRQRLAELRERPIPGTQTLGEFMQRRMSPAMATVASTATRLAALSQRVERAGALLRTRVDIATEAQNQQLLSRLAHGQSLQLRLQSTVEGLSIAAISYYVVSLVLYGAKAAKAAGLAIHPEAVAGASIPLVLWGVWRTVRRIHEKLHRDDG